MGEKTTWERVAKSSTFSRVVSEVLRVHMGLAWYKPVMRLWGLLLRKTPWHSLLILLEPPPPKAPKAQSHSKWLKVDTRGLPQSDPKSGSRSHDHCPHKHYRPKKILRELISVKITAWLPTKIFAELFLPRLPKSLACKSVSLSPSL